jgi:hypothetical protein
VGPLAHGQLAIEKIGVFPRRLTLGLFEGIDGDFG